MKTRTTFGRWVRQSWILCLALASPWFSTSAQILPGTPDVFAVPNDPECSRCEIQLRHVLRIGSTDGPDALWAIPSDVVRLEDGLFLVTETEGGRLLLYNLEGKLLDAFDKRGEGPRELGGGGRVSKLGGTSVLFTDWANGRFAEIEVGRGKISVERTLRADQQLPMRVFPVDSVQVVGVNTYSRMPDGSRRALHSLHVGPEEVVTRESFDPVGSGRLSEAQRGRVVWVNGAEIWSASEAKYQVTRWTRDGKPTAVYKFKKPWFEGEVRGAVGPPSEPPDPLLNSLWTDEDGLLWVFSWRPSQGYDLAWEGLTERARGGSYSGAIDPSTTSSG